MNLNTTIKPELWAGIVKSYEAENYKNAILDAIHYLTGLLRDRSGLDGDGERLVGQALGGDSPRLKINRFQTQSEKDEQRGYEHLIRGLYAGIRNPRSHEGIEDTQERADAIIHFVDYLVGVLEQSTQPFTIDDYIARVFDPEFVELDTYADMLVRDLPDNKYLDVLIEVFRRKLDGDGTKLKIFVRSLITKLTSEQLDEFLAIVSAELRRTGDKKCIILTLQILPSYLWPMVKEDAKLRIENMLIKALNAATNNDGTVNTEGAFASWATDILTHFSLRDQWVSTVVNKLNGGPEQIHYVAKYFLAQLPNIAHGPNVMRITRRIRFLITEDEFGSSDTYLRTQLRSCFQSLPENWRKSILGEKSSLSELIGEDEEIPF